MSELKWEINEDSQYVATLMMNSEENSTAVLLIKKNENCFSSIPTNSVNSFIRPIDVTFEEADVYLREKYGVLAPDEVDENRLEYALEKFEKDFHIQMIVLLDFNL